MDEKSPFHIIYLDFTKAFDKISHEKLIFRLKCLGISGKLLNWLIGFLKGRTQRVRIDNCLSHPINVSSGVPQGSVLGPLLFAIYVDTLHEQVGNNFLYLFADDSKLANFVRSVMDHANLQIGLEGINVWSKDWQLPLAPDKCRIMSVGGPLLYDYTLDGKLLNPTSEQVDLGVKINDDLKFSAHCSTIAAKGHQRAFLLRKCFRYSNAYVLVKAFKVYVRPLLEYCSEIWNPYLKKDVRRIENVQRRFTKYLPELHGLTYGQRLEKLNLPSLEFRRLIIDLCTCYKLLRSDSYQGHGPPLISPDAKTTRGHNWRFDWKKANCNSRHYSFIPRVGRVWNSLPCEVVDAPSLHTFKNRINTHLVNSRFLFV